MNKTRVILHINISFRITRSQDRSSFICAIKTAIINTFSGIPRQGFLTFGLRPFEPLGNFDGAILHPCLCSAPVDALMHRVGVGNRIGMVQHPVKREQPHVEVTHDGLPDKIDAVLKMPFIQLGDGFLVLQHLWEVRPMVIAPEPEEAVKLMCTHCHGYITSSGDFRKLSGGLEAMAPIDAFHVLF